MEGGVVMWCLYYEVYLGTSHWSGRPPLSYEDLRSDHVAGHVGSLSSQFLWLVKGVSPFCDLLRGTWLRSYLFWAMGGHQSSDWFTKSLATYCFFNELVQTWEQSKSLVDWLPWLRPVMLHNIPIEGVVVLGCDSEARYLLGTACWLLPFAGLKSSRQIKNVFYWSWFTALLFYYAGWSLVGFRAKSFRPTADSCAHRQDH